MCLIHEYPSKKTLQNKAKFGMFLLSPFWWLLQDRLLLSCIVLAFLQTRLQPGAVFSNL